MAISENSLHPYIKGLVEENGELTVTELNKMLREILTLDADDKTILSGRNDDKFSQIVRNVVAHAPEGVSCRYGYLLDKTKKPAVFYALESNAETGGRVQITSKSVGERKKKSRRFAARKVNFKSLAEEHTALGDAGESFALEYERDRLKRLGVSFDVNEEVIHFSHKFGDGAGYDILSRSGEDFALRYIEVKTTKGDLSTPFYMSENEKAFMEIYEQNSFLYRVYNYDIATNIGEIEMIPAAVLRKDYIFDPVTYKVTKKAQP